MTKRHPHLQFQLISLHFLYVEKRLLSFSSAQNCSFFRSSNSRIAATMRVQIHSIERVKKSLVDWAAAIFHRAAQNFGSPGRKLAGVSFFKDETPHDSKCVPMWLTDCVLYCSVLEHTAATIWISLHKMKYGFFEPLRAQKSRVIEKVMKSDRKIY